MLERFKASSGVDQKDRKGGGVKLRYLNYLSRYLLSTSETRWSAIFFTRDCTRSCSYCQAPTYGRDDDIPIGEWFKIVDKLASWGVLAINIVGGEPTLRQELPDLVQYIDAKGILPILTSNGDRVSHQQLDKLLDSGVGVLQISLDSLAGFEKCNRDALDLLEHAGRRQVLPILCATATSENVDEVPDLVEIAAQKGIMFNCSPYQGVGGSLSTRKPGLGLPREKAEALVEFLEESKSRTGLIANHKVYLDNLIRYTYDSRWKCNPNKDYWITVNNDGTLMRCQEYPSNIPVCELSDLRSDRWISYKEDTVNRCSGCFWQPYVEKECFWSRKSAVIRECLSSRAIRWLLSNRSEG